MLFRVVIVAYGVGVFMGLLGVAEWLVDRAERRQWLVRLTLALVSIAVALLGSLTLKTKRRRT